MIQVQNNALSVFHLPIDVRVCVVCHMSACCYIAVADFHTSTGGDVAARAAVKIHGIFPSATEARSAAHQLANEQTDVDTFVMEDMDRWIVVHPTTNFAEEEEEIPTSQNDDPSQGRYGSVCNVRKSTAASNAPSSSSLPSDETEPPRVQGGLDTPITKKKAIQTQCMQLDELLSSQPDAAQIQCDPKAYAHCREHYATLRAFERRLHALYTESLQKCQHIQKEIAVLDEAQPTYRSQYRARYVEALRESGIDPSEVRLMRFIEP
jgi:hypothetical protein